MCYWTESRVLGVFRMLVGYMRVPSESDQIEAILEGLAAGASKASICRNFGIKRSTLYDALARVA